MAALRGCLSTARTGLERKPAGPGWGCAPNTSSVGCFDLSDAWWAHLYIALMNGMAQQQAMQSLLIERQTHQAPLAGRRRWLLKAGLSALRLGAASPVGCGQLPR